VENFLWKFHRIPVEGFSRTHDPCGQKRETFHDLYVILSQAIADFQTDVVPSPANSRLRSLLTSDIHTVRVLITEDGIFKCDYRVPAISGHPICPVSIVVSNFTHCSNTEGVPQFNKMSTIAAGPRDALCQLKSAVQQLQSCT